LLRLPLSGHVHPLLLPTEANASEEKTMYSPPLSLFLNFSYHRSYSLMQYRQFIIYPHSLVLTLISLHCDEQPRKSYLECINSPRLSLQSRVQIYSRRCISQVSCSKGSPPLDNTLCVISLLGLRLAKRPSFNMSKSTTDLEVHGGPAQVTSGMSTHSHKFAV
jgi:hypothetical protein